MRFSARQVYQRMCFMIHQQWLEWVAGHWHLASMLLLWWTLDNTPPLQPSVCSLNLSFSFLPSLRCSLTFLHNQWEMNAFLCVLLFSFPSCELFSLKAFISIVTLLHLHCFYDIQSVSCNMLKIILLFWMWMESETFYSSNFFSVYS